MQALRPLIREFQLLYLQRRSADLQQRDPMHADLPGIVQRINALVAERPPIETRPRSRCDSLAGLCARDPACADRHCPGLHQRDGGHRFAAGVVFPIEPDARPRP